MITKILVIIDFIIEIKIIIIIEYNQGVIEIKILNHRPVLEIFQKTIDTTT